MCDITEQRLTGVKRHNLRTGRTPELGPSVVNLYLEVLSPGLDAAPSVVLAGPGGAAVDGHEGVVSIYRLVSVFQEPQMIMPAASFIGVVYRRSEPGDAARRVTFEEVPSRRQAIASEPVGRPSALPVASHGELGEYEDSFL